MKPLPPEVLAAARRVAEQAPEIPAGADVRCKLRSLLILTAPPVTHQTAA